jgi:Spy/CpxP family protein refolding chaperone
MFLAGVLVGALALSAPAPSAEIERLQSIPEDLVQAWERLQRALQEWSGQLQERFGYRGAREDRPVISEILNQKDDLRLNPEQVKKLEQLRDGFQRQSIRNDADLRIVELDIAALLDEPKVDIAKVEAKIRESEKLRADVRIGRIRAIEQAKGVLTAEQRKKFDDRSAMRLRGRNPSANERESSFR